MKNENNFELSNIELNDAEQLVEIKDDELRQVTGGGYTMPTEHRQHSCQHVN